MTKSTNGEVVSVRGNTSLLLDEGDASWLVERGTVAVFSVRTAPGSPSGPRRYLFSCKRGDALCGAGDAASDADFSFLVVGLEDSELVRLPTKTLIECAGSLDSAESAAFQGWIERLDNLLASHAPVSHVDRAEGERLTLAEGQRVRAAEDGVRWVHVQSGSVALLGASELSVGRDAGWIPLSRESWFQASEPTEVALRPFDALEYQERADGLRKLHELCFRHLEHLERAETVAEDARLQQRERLVANDTAAALNDLTQVLLDRDTIPEGDSGLMGALTIIGRELNIRFHPPAASEDMRRVRDPVEAIARASRVRIRRVRLVGEWWKTDAGTILGFAESDGRPLALVRKRNHYVVIDIAAKTKRRVNHQLASELSSSGVAFIRPLPEKQTSSLTRLGIFAASPYLRDIGALLFLSLTAALIGMLIPISTRMIIDYAIPDANFGLLYQFAAALGAIAIGQAMLAYSQSILSLRVGVGAASSIQAATIDRLLRLPSRFFRRFSSGDLMNRAMMVTEVSNEINSTAFSAILTSVMALVNFGLCFYYNSKLAWIAVVVALISSLITTSLSVMIRRKALVLETSSGKLFGLTVQLIGGVAKLRVAGAEQRAFNHWAREYAQQVKLTNDIQRLNDWSDLTNTALSTGSVVCLFYFAASMLMSDPNAAMGAAAGAALTMGTFLAFYSAFNSLIGGATDLSGTIVDVMDSWAKRDLMKPLLEEPTEVDESRVDPGRLSGAISVSDVVFRYRNDGPLVLDGVTIRANPGEFVAIVGPSGCGKSTLLRLLMGFETPASGTLYYDDQDLAGLDHSAVRRQIGVVLQSAHISAGSLFDNITLGSVATMDEAREAARDAGFSDDIQQMPMGMHTHLSEGATNLSGGQRQRLLIARALVGNPRILVFDEATSALDNRTQEIVTQSVKRRQATRIVVAHRLSTIRDADRIYVLDNGKVVQTGSFQELIDQQGPFRRMASRQLA